MYPARVRERVDVERFNPLLDRNIPILANELANINADAALNASGLENFNSFFFLVFNSYQIRQAMNTNLHKSNRWNVHLFLAVAGMTGIVGLFLPFSWSTSPLKAVSENNLWQIATPAFLSVFITGASIRWLISGSFSKAEKAIAYILSVLSTCVTLLFIFSGGIWPSDVQEWLAYTIPFVVILSGSYLMFKNSGKQVLKETNPLIAMQLAYLANCLFCLVSFWPPEVDKYGLGGWQIGAYFCLAASIIYLIQIALFLMQKNETAYLAEVSVP